MIRNPATGEPIMIVVGDERYSPSDYITSVCSAIAVSDERESMDSALIRVFSMAVVRLEMGICAPIDVAVAELARVMTDAEWSDPGLAAKMAESDEGYDKVMAAMRAEHLDGCPHHEHGPA